MADRAFFLISFARPVSSLSATVFDHRYIVNNSLWLQTKTDHLLTYVQPAAATGASVYATYLNQYWVNCNKLFKYRLIETFTINFINEFFRSTQSIWRFKCVNFINIISHPWRDVRARLPRDSGYDQGAQNPVFLKHAPADRRGFETFEDYFYAN